MKLGLFTVIATFLMTSSIAFADQTSAPSGEQNAPEQTSKSQMQLSDNDSPPGLEKTDRTPRGLENKTPEGWSHGKKQGWNKTHGHHHKHHHGHHHGHHGHHHGHH